MDLAGQIASIGALAEPMRRDLYAFVASQALPVGREAAAAALGIPLHTAKFHLDRMVDDGLLEVEYRRPTGRSGPGAGRPTKLYRRAGREFAISLPERRYDLIGEILARAVLRASSGAPLPAALRESAFAEGSDVGESIAVSGSDGGLDRVAETLAEQGYEPRRDGGELVLANCPFDRLAREHTDLVCGLNESYVQGIVAGLGAHGVRAYLDPADGRCCVRATVTT